MVARFPASFALVAGMLLALSGASSAQTLQTLGVLPGGDASVAVAINSSNQVAGVSTVSGGVRAFIWQNGVMTDLEVPGFDSAASVVAINGTGQVIGNLPTTGHAFIWSNGVTTLLNGPQGSITATALNDSGQVVGSMLTSSGFSHAFVWQSGQNGNEPLDLGTLGYQRSGATAINNSDQIAGFAEGGNAGSNYGHAVIWQNQVITDLFPGASANSSSATHINDSGQIAGLMSTSGGETHAFIWQGGSATDLGTANAIQGLNSSGQVIGAAGSGLGYAGVVWQAASPVTTLADLGGGVSFPQAINDAGQIVGLSYVANGDFHAALWQNGAITDLGSLGTYPGPVDCGCPFTLPSLTSGVAVSINSSGSIAGSSVTATRVFEAFASIIAPTSSPILLTVSAATGVYGGNVTLQATLTSNGSPVSGQAIAFTVNGSSAGSALTAGSGVATLPNVSLGSTVAGSHAGGVGATFAGTSTYDAGSGAASLTVAPATLTVSGVTALDKTYDATTAASLNVANAGLNGVMAGDSVNLVTAQASGAFADKQVGTNKAVTTSGLTLSGAAANNYTLTLPSAIASITAATLTVSAAGVSKGYDGTTAATVTLSDDRIAGDVLSPTYTAAAFDDKNVGNNNKTVTVSGIAIAGTDAGNYTLSATTASTTASVTVRPLNVTATGASKPYDGGTSATVTLADNRLAGDTFTASYSAATFASANSGTGIAISVTGISISGPDAGNYAANDSASASADITTVDATIHVSGFTGPYDGSPHGATGTATGVNNENLAALLNLGSSFTDVPGGMAAWTFTGDGNYNAANGEAAITIEPAPLTVTANPQTKVYGSGDPALTYSAAGFHGGDTAAVLTGSLSRVAGEDAGSYAITQGTLAAANYTIAFTGDSLGITPATLTVTATAASRVYDGTTNAAFTLADNRIAQETFTVTASGAAFSDKHVGAGKTVTVSGIVISGPGSGNYVANASADATASITTRSLVITAGGVDKTYDGTASASVLLSDDRVAGDVFDASYASAAFADPNAGTGKTVTVEGLSISGVDAGNYVFNASASTTATIGRAVPVVSWNAPANLEYPTPLGAAELNAVASVPGTFVYSPSPGAVLSLGDPPANFTTYSLTVTFTPADSVNYESPITKSVMVTVQDTIAPVVTYTGNTGSYTIDQTIAITCSTSDSGSGVASTTCEDITGPAYSFAIGSNTYSATATDRVGHVGQASTTFTVVASADSLVALVNVFIPNSGAASGLIATLNAIATSPNQNAKQGQLGAFANDVRAQVGKTLTQQQADTLVRLASQL